MLFRSLRVWCLVSRLLVSATFLEAPVRFQPHRPLEQSDWWLGRAGRKEPCDERGGSHLTVFRALFWTCVPTLQTAEPQLYSLEGRTNSPGMATESGMILGPVPSQFLPQRVEEETDHLLGLPGRGQQLRKPGDSGEGRHCDSL